MKKTVKSLIIAASVAAVAGIGAVSFAAWNAGSVQNQTIEKTTGSIATSTGTITLTDGLGTKKLVPYNQKVQLDSATMGQVQVITVAYGGAGAPAADKMNLTMTLTTNEITTSGSKFMYKLEEVSTVPTTTDGWFDLEKDTAVALSSVASQKVSIILVSENTDDMNANYVITFGATEKQAS